ncbi:MAG TPA: helix-hairpin-helix domain-containing protein [Verrucomicrobiae bacterium]|jgi:competence ComEA-like helix-hairpin-helix protein|nr:helix-hairpin-helix domain-containing protein [Verrucomicrobiae bacterium]
MLYSRPQLSLLLLLGVALLAGLVVREWRAGFPEAAARVEAFDRDEAIPAPGPVPLATSRPSRPPPSPPTRPAPAPHPGPSAQAEPLADPRPLDLNTATAEQIARLPGVGPGLAHRIVEERQRRGRFEGPEGLRSVLGVGPRKLAALRDLVTTAP